MTTFSKITTDELCLSYTDEGHGPAVVALHGFPDSWRTWDAATVALVEAGYRVIRLALRGYAPSDVPANGAYGIRHLAHDVVALIDALGVDQVVILGHDWGASVAYYLASLVPARITALVALAVPPSATARTGARELLMRPHKLYLGFGVWSDWWLRRDGFYEVHRLYRLWSPRWRHNEDHIEAVITALRPPERSRAAVDYYRRKPDMAFLPLPDMPCLLIYGSDEPQVRQEGFEAARSRLEPPSHVLRIEGVGHWPHLEAPKTVLPELLTFLRDCCPSD